MLQKKKLQRIYGETQNPNKLLSKPLWMTLREILRLPTHVKINVSSSAGVHAG